jgi:hypothetical protein
MHRTDMVLHVANLIQYSVRERSFESHDLDVFGEGRCAFKNGSAPSINILSVTYDLSARHDRTLPLEQIAAGIIMERSWHEGIPGFAKPDIEPDKTMVGVLPHAHCFIGHVPDLVRAVVDGPLQHL